MTWKNKRERDREYYMKLANQIMNVNRALIDMYDHKDNVNITMSEMYGKFKPGHTPNFRDMQAMSFREDCFVQSLVEFFTTLKRADPLNKYEIKFTVKSKQKDKMITKEKRKMLKK